MSPAVVPRTTVHTKCIRKFYFFARASRARLPAGTRGERLLLLRMFEFEGQHPRLIRDIANFRDFGISWGDGRKKGGSADARDYAAPPKIKKVRMDFQHVQF